MGLRFALFLHFIISQKLQLKSLYSVCIFITSKVKILYNKYFDATYRCYLCRIYFNLCKCIFKVKKFLLFYVFMLLGCVNIKENAFEHASSITTHEGLLLIISFHLLTFNLLTVFKVYIILTLNTFYSLIKYCPLPEIHLVKV